MTRSPLRRAAAMLFSRATTPLVIGIFLLVYVGIAFFTDDALIVLMDLTRRSVVLVVLLALLPLTSIARIITEIRGFLARRRALSGDAADMCPGLFSESIELTASPAFARVREMLGSLGYKTRLTGTSLGAYRGVTVFPARLTFLVGTFFLYFGILISLTTRMSYREPVVEGVPIPAPLSNGGVVERIRLEPSTGRILSKDLIMEVAASGRGDAPASFGIYPPGLYQGSFVYPRYLGVALFVQFAAPDLQEGFEKHAILNMYPPGKEAAVEIPGSPYRLIVSLAESGDGSDSYMTGRMNFMFKLLKGKDVLFSEKVPGGSGFSREGYHIAFPDFRRMVITDFIQDYGVYFIWASGLLFAAATLFWLPMRLFFPRRELLFIRDGAEMTRAYSRAEGKERDHGGVFNEALDMISKDEG